MKSPFMPVAENSDLRQILAVGEKAACKTNAAPRGLTWGPHSLGTVEGWLAPRRGIEGDVPERLIGVAAEGGDGGDAHHNDQGQHHRVLDGGRAVFLLDKCKDFLSEGEHGGLQADARVISSRSGEP